MRQKQKEKRSFSFLAMPSAVITYLKLQQMSGKSKNLRRRIISTSLLCVFSVFKYYHKRGSAYYEN